MKQQTRTVVPEEDCRMSAASYDRSTISQSHRHTPGLLRKCSTARIAHRVAAKVERLQRRILLERRREGRRARIGHRVAVKAERLQ